MRVVTAVEEYIPKDEDICVFLAGGITNCWGWQSAVIDELDKMKNTDSLVVFNPRRPNFPIDDPNAAQEQIEWEYKYLHLADIFSMYFTSGESTQPICMYELGVHIIRSVFDSKPESVIVSVEDGYIREQDVVIQVGLALKDDLYTNSAVNPINPVNVHADARSHAQLIYDDYISLLGSL